MMCSENNAMIRSILFFLLTISASMTVSAQSNLGRNWYFGQNAGLIWNSINKPDTVNSSFSVATRGSDSVLANYGCGIVQNDINGNLLFYGHANSIDTLKGYITTSRLRNPGLWNRFHLPIENSYDLRNFKGSGGTQSLASFKIESSESRYFVFTIDSIRPKYPGVYYYGDNYRPTYFIVDLDSSNGKGAILDSCKLGSTLASPLESYMYYDSTSGSNKRTIWSSIACTKNAINSGYWIIYGGVQCETIFLSSTVSTRALSNVFASFLLQGDSIKLMKYNTILMDSTYIINGISYRYTFIPNSNGIGDPNVRFNHKGDMVAVPSSEGVLLYDFNQQTGELTNLRRKALIQNFSSSVYSCLEFSPNDSLIYLSSGSDLSLFLPTMNQGGIYQLGVFDSLLGYLIPCSTSPGYSMFRFCNLIQKFSYGSLQCGVDGKIYSPLINMPFMGVIDSPNVRGIGCGFRPFGIQFKSSTKLSGGLPFLLQSDLAKAKYSGCLPFAQVLTPPNNSISSIRWYFPDGSINYNQNPVLIINRPGRFTVRYSSTKLNGQIDSGYFWVDVYSDPSNSFRLNQLDTVCWGNSSTFQIDTLGNSNLSFLVFDTLNNIIQVDSSLKFKFRGIYQGINSIKIIAHNKLTGCTDTLYKNVLFHNLPNTKLVITNLNNCNQFNGIIQFTDTTSTKSTFSSSITNLSNRSASVSFSDTGLNQAKVFFRNSYGCYDSAMVRGYVAPTPVANFGLLSTTGCQFVRMTFVDSSSYVFLNPPAGFSGATPFIHFDFGDGDSLTVFQPQQNYRVSHLYRSTGNYSLRQIVFNGYCSDTLNRPNYINIVPAPRPGLDPINQSTTYFNGFIPQRWIQGCAPFALSCRHFFGLSRFGGYRMGRWFFLCFSNGYHTHPFSHLSNSWKVLHSAKLLWRYRLRHYGHPACMGTPSATNGFWYKHYTRLRNSYCQLARFIPLCRQYLGEFWERIRFVYQSIQYVPYFGQSANPTSWCIVLQKSANRHSRTKIALHRYCE